MPVLKPNTFTTYSFSPEELESATIFTSFQKQAIQTVIANYAEAKLAITFDPKDPYEYGIQVAWHDGKIEALRALLDNSEEMEEILRVRALQSKEQ